MEETLGKRIARHRKRLGMTQEQMAEKLGVTAQAVSKWENDQSCPDITMLPRLAELFGITADALLGREPVYEAELVSERGDEAGGGWSFRYDSGRRGAVGGAVLILLVGGLLLASRLLKWEAGLWSIAWPSALLVFGVMELLKKFRFTGIACTLLGGYYLVKNLGIVQLHAANELIFPALILIFGLCLLVDALRKPKKPRVCFRKNGNGQSTHSGFSQQGERFTCSLSFGEAHRLVELPRLSGGEATCSFGELELDLSGCGEIVDECTVEVSCSFGEMTVLVPRQYRVQCEAVSSFGGIETEGTADPSPKGTICLTGGVSFGALNIRYV